MAIFNPCYEKVIVLEGGYVLHQVPGDRGGMTYAGIARSIWPDWPGWIWIDGERINSQLTAAVRDFYRQHFWDMLRGDDIKSQEVALVVYAFAVNAGLKTAVRIIQRICKTTPDGIMGNKTIGALNIMLEDDKDERIFILLFGMLQIFRYKDICLHDQRRVEDKIVSNEKFLCGWINRVQRGMA